MISIIRHLKRFPGYIRNGLLAQKALQFFDSAGIILQPYYLVREGADLTKFDFAGDKFNEFEFRKLKSEDMKQLDHFDGRATTENELLERLNAGHLSYGLINKNTIVAFTWCNPSEIHHHLSIHRTLKDNEVYLYDAQSLYKFRGRGLMPYLRYKCYVALNEEGKNIFYSCSDYFNKPAIRFKKKLNADFLLVGIDIGIKKVFQKGIILKQLCKSIYFEAAN